MTVERIIETAPAGKQVATGCLSCPESCKQHASVVLIACARAGLEATESDAPPVPEIGESHGDIRSIDTMPRWLRVGLYQLSRPLSDLEVEALWLWFAEAAENRQICQDKRTEELPPVGEVGGHVKITPKTLRRVLCKECGTEFKPRSPAHRYCSDECQRTAARKKDTILKRRRRTPARTV